LLAMHQRVPCEAVVRSAFPALLAWNRWWHAHRRNRAGTISLGSDPFEPRIGDAAEFVQPNCAAGAAIESGVGNAAIYDGVGFDPATHLMDAEDVGMTSLYVADCEALAELARVVGDGDAQRELTERRAQYATALGSLWSHEAGTFLNRSVSDRAW